MRRVWIFLGALVLISSRRSVRLPAMPSYQPLASNCSASSLPMPDVAPTKIAFGIVSLVLKFRFQTPACDVTDVSGRVDCRRR